MKILNLFSSKRVANSDIVPVDVDTTDNEKESAMTADHPEEEKKSNIVTIKWGTGMPIDVIYNYIHKNFEDDGYQDALVNQDIAYRDTRISIIRNDLEMLFNRITLCYKKNIRETQVRMDNSRKAFALSAAANLEAQLATYEEHLAVIEEMKQLFDDNDSKMLTMIESYKRGFLKGINAATMDFINNNH
jgi:hypothetical protein